MLKRLSIGGNPNLGVYAQATEDYLFISDQATKKEVAQFVEALEVEPVRLTVGGTHLVGSLLTATRRGILVSDILTVREEALLADTGLEVATLSHTLNAAGNMVLANDNGALVGIEYPEPVRRLIADVLKVETTVSPVAGLVTVGMAGATNARGALVHPKATPEERETIRRALRVEVMPGTINHGTALIGAGLVANTRGAAIGTATTGIEIGRIDEALGFLDAPRTASHRTV
jgi:translation initiation factor 6